MHRSKTLALSLAVAGLAASSTLAAAQTGEAQKPQAATDSSRRTMDPIGRLLERREQLELTDDQARRLEAIRAKYRERHQARMEQMRRERESRSALRASMDSARAEVAAVLTPEQEKRVEAMREEWKRTWRQEHGRRHGHGGSHGKHHDQDG